MNLDNASASHELLQIHEKEDRSDYDYQLYDSEQKNKRSCLSFNGKNKRVIKLRSDSIFPRIERQTYL
jgi:hypothetical protein